jgi:signal transduction histidine kinase
VANEEIEQLAALAERERIARDLHDSSVTPYR